MYKNRALKRPILQLLKKNERIVEERIVERHTCFGSEHWTQYYQFNKDLNFASDLNLIDVDVLELFLNLSLGADLKLSNSIKT
jgi:hypothetical protein